MLLAYPVYTDFQSDRIPNIRPYSYSVFGYTVSGKFGEDRGGCKHAGIDYAIPYGSPVNVTATGRVEFAGMRGRYGLLVIVDHGNGYHTYYAHLSKQTVLEGQEVFKGQKIAESGDSGNVPAHLHYGLLKTTTDRRGVKHSDFIFPYVQA